MSRTLRFGLLMAFALGVSPVFAADAIVSDAPPLPDLGGIGALPGDLSVPGLELPVPPPQALATEPASSTTAPAAIASPTSVPQTVPATTAPAAVVTEKVDLPAPPNSATVVASPTLVAEVATPTTVVETAAPTAAAPMAASVAPASAPADSAAVVLEGLEAYFPMKTGAKWTYVSKSGQTRAMECLSRDVQGKSVSGTFLVTTTAPVTQTWKLVGGKVVLGANASSLRAGWVRLVTPVGATIPRWVYDRLDGTGSYYKQEVGPVEAGGKKYAAGLTVTERTLKGAAQVSFHKWFYAKGVGLVMEADYGATGAPIANKTFELQSAQ